MRVEPINPDVLGRLSESIVQTAPLFPVAAGMITGIVLDQSLEASIWIYLPVFVSASGLATLRRVRALVGPLVVFVAATCAGGALHLKTSRAIPPSSIERYAEAGKRIIRVRGTVASEPRVLDAPPNPFQRWTYGHERTAFLLNAESVPGMSGPAGEAASDIPVTGRIRVTVREAVLDLRENERVEVFGWLHPLEPPRNAGAFDWSAFQRRQGVVASMVCKHRENVRPLEPHAPRRGDWVTRLRTTVRGMLTDDLATGGGEEASLLEAMILGHRSRLDRRLNEIFIKAGCIHFLAVSGIHVVIVMFFARLAAGMLLGGLRARTWAMLVAVLVYAVVAEPRPPILRATVIASLYCLSRLLGRGRTCLNWISASAIVLLLFNPSMVFDVGFQMSFGAVLGVSYVTPAIMGAASAPGRWWQRAVLKEPITSEDLRIPKRRPVRSPFVRRALGGARRLIRGYGLTALAVTFGAWVTAAPIIACHFQRMQPWASVNSLLVFPLVTVIMGLGFAKMAVGVLAAPVGSIFGVWLTALDSLLIRIVERLGSLPWADRIVEPPPWWLIVAHYAFLLSLVLRFPRNFYFGGPALPVPQATNGAHSAWRGRICAATAVLLVFLFGLREWTGQPASRLAVTVLSVGPGSATVIELPDGRTVLYDAGSSSPVDVGRTTVVPYLRHRGITRIDRAYISHPNLDHFSGLPSIIEEVDTGAVFVNERFEARSPPGSPARYLLDMLAERGQPVETPDPATRGWNLAGVRFELLSPHGDLARTVSTNDTSTVLRLRYAGRSILLTGDVQERAQRALLRRGDLHADVLVLPHHGGVQPSTGEFIRAVEADVLIRSSGRPMDETLNGLQAVVGATPLYNTADVGAVQVVIDNEGVHVVTAR